MDGAPVEGGHRLHLHYLAPAAGFVGGFVGFLDEALAVLGTVVANVDGDLRRFLVLHNEQAVGEVLQVTKRAALAADEATRVVFGVHVEQAAIVHGSFLHGGIKAKAIEQVFENAFGYG